MPFPAVIAIWAALKTVLTWLVRFILRWLIVQIVLYLTVLFLSDLIKELSEKVAAEIKDFNNFILTQVFTVEGFLFALENDIYEFIIIAWNGLKLKIETALDSILPEQFDIVLTLINFAAWIDTLFTDITNAFITELSNIIGNITGPITGKIRTCLDYLLQIETLVNTAVNNLYDSIESSINGQVAQYNTNLSGLFDNINSMVDFFNASILEIKTFVEAGKGDIDLYNAALPSKHEMIVAWLNWYIQNKGLKVKDKDLDDLLVDLRATLNSTYPDVSKANLEIDFDSYIYTITPDINNYILSIQIPANTFNFQNIPVVQTLRNELNAVIISLDALPTSVAQQILSVMPNILKANFQNRLRQFLLIAITTSILQKKGQIISFFDGISTDLETEMEKGKQLIIQKTQKIIKDIEDYELMIVSRIPDVLKPSLQKAIESIESNLANKGDEIVVNIDGVVPDTVEIDRIIQTFQADIHANADPNKFNSDEWNIQDIYRMLCNYFTRSERVALCIFLMTQDLEMDPDDFDSIFGGS